MFGFEIIFFIMFFLVFALVFGTILFTLIRSASTWSKNNRAPQLTVEARIVDKCAYRTASNRRNHTAAAQYFVTFEVESGDRMELCVPREEFGLLVVGDVGRLRFQGTRYLAFSRDREDSAY